MCIRDSVYGQQKKAQNHADDRTGKRKGQYRADDVPRDAKRTQNRKLVKHLHLLFPPSFYCIRPLRCRSISSMTILPLSLIHI